MKRLFLSITKGEELRFLGHLDFLRTVERAVMRSEIPVAFSEGFNPHMKLSLDSALGVGVTADPLYLEIRLEKDMPVEEVNIEYCVLFALSENSLTKSVIMISNIIPQLLYD